MFPNIGVSVLSKAFVIKPIHLCDLATFVVTPKNGDAISVSYFQGDQKGDGLQRVITSVDVISHEQIVRFRALPSDTK